MYLPLRKVADTPFHIQGSDTQPYKELVTFQVICYLLWVLQNCIFAQCFAHAKGADRVMLTTRDTCCMCTSCAILLDFVSYLFCNCMATYAIIVLFRPVSMVVYTLRLWLDTQRLKCRMLVIIVLHAMFQTVQKPGMCSLRMVP